jgi:hypothetical protein
MDTQIFQHWLAQLGQLNTQQKSAFKRALNAPPQQDALEGSLPVLQACPHCAAQAAQLAPRIAALSLSRLPSHLQYLNRDGFSAFT